VAEIKTRKSWQEKLETQNQEAQAARLREEGHTIEEGRGKKLRVRDFEKVLVEV